MAPPAPIKCKAAVAWGPKQELVIEEIDVEAPRAGEVRIRIVASSLCHTDLTFLNLEQGGLFPRIFGHESAGIVESVGEGVEEFKEGDHVVPVYTPLCGKCTSCKSPSNNLCEKYFTWLSTIAMLQPLHQKPRFSITKGGTTHSIFPFFTSGFTECTVLPVECVAKIDPNAPLDKACLFACGVPTGLGAVWNTAKVKRGSSVAIFGLGTIGLAVADGARISGASRIIGIDINCEKFELGKKFGVTEFLNPNDYEKPIQEVLWDLTSGGVDYAFECVGKAHLMLAAIECTRPGCGKTVIAGLDNPGNKLSFSPSTLFGRSVEGCIFGGFKGKQVSDLVDKLVKKEVDVDKYITHVLPFEKVNEAIDLLKSGKSLRCILMMDLSDCKHKL